MPSQALEPLKKRALERPARSEEADFFTQYKDSLAEVKDVLNQLPEALAFLNISMTKLKRYVIKVQRDKAEPQVRRLVRSKPASMAPPRNKLPVKVLDISGDGCET